MKCRKCNKLDLVFEQDPIIPYPPPPANLLLSHALLKEIEEEKRKSSIEAIKLRLSQVDERAAYLDTLFLELKKEQDRCTEERRSLADSMRLYESVSAPIKRASDDALIEIFTAYTAANPHTRNHLPAPMVLAGVCRRWRDVCTNTHSLWPSVSIHLNHDSSRYEAKASIFQIFASRAGTSPLQVVISDNLNYAESDLSRNIDTAGLQLLINEMAVSAGRWHTFNAKCSWALLERIWEEICQAQLNKPLSMLQRLDVRCANYASRFMLLYAPLDLSSMTPSLRHARLGPGTTDLLLPWKALESWGGVLASPKDFINVLTKCPNLSQCTSLKFWQDRPLIAAATPLHHQRLHTLAVSFKRSLYNFDYFFSSLALPALVDLRIHAEHSVVWLNGDFARFLHRSSCTLQRLALDLGPRFSHTSLLKILTLVPSLTEFELVERRVASEALAFNRAVLQALTRGAAAPLLPNLQTLSLVGHFARDLPAALSAMLRSRAQPPSALRALFLEPHPAGFSVGPFDVLDAAGAHAVRAALADTALRVVVCDAGPEQD